VTDLVLQEEPYDGPSAQQLVAAVQQEYVSRYGGPDETPVTPEEFAPPLGRFVIGYLGVEPVAMGGLRVRDPETAEIKRMFIRADHRGRGLSRVVLVRLEELAGAMGLRRVILETGPAQPEAMGLYESSGYQRIEPFGFYRDAPGSVCYAKTVQPMS